MLVKFRILNKELDQHSVVVRYYTDTITEDDLATSFILDSQGNSIIDRNPDGSPKRCQTDYNINIWNIEATQISANSEVIINHIKNCAPFDWFELKQAVKDPNTNTDMPLIDSLVGVEFTAEKPIISVSASISNSISPAPNLSEDDLQKLIDSIVSSNTVSSS